MKKSLAVSALLLAYASQVAAESSETPCYEERSGGFTVYGAYLLWEVIQDGMTYAETLPGGVQGIIDAIMSGGSTVVLNEKIFIDEPQSKWKSGFKAGIGYEGCSRWDIDLVWTRLHEKITSSVSDINNGIIPSEIILASLIGIIANPTITGFSHEAISNWKFTFDTLDFQIGQTATLGNCFDLRGAVGVKGAWIKQHQFTNYLGFTIMDAPITIEVFKKNEFRAVGPSFTLDGSLQLGSYFSLNGGITGAFLYGKTHADIFPVAIFGTNMIDVDVISTRKNRIKPMVDAFVGIDVHTDFCDDWRVAVGVGYEVQYWWNQFIVPLSFETSILGPVTAHGDLVLHGLTAYAALTF